MKVDCEVVQHILQLFGDASGLHINLSKSTITCIRCDEAVELMVAGVFNCQICHFPIKYLGLPLSIGRLRRADIWPLIDKFSAKLPGWIPKLLNPGGRLVLTKSVLMAIPLHFLAVLELPDWALKILYKRCRGFIWKGQQEVNGGHCLLSWSKVCMPVQYGGLGVLNLRYFGCALRCRWPWLRWDRSPKPWCFIPLPDDKDATAMVRAASFVHLGDGKRAKFWTDKWLPGKRAIVDAYPLLASFVKNSDLTVAQAMARNRWIKDIKGGVSTAALDQYLSLWDELQQVQLRQGAADTLIWCHSKDGCFSTSSAYSLFFAANRSFPCARPIWKSKAPPRCKFFMWLVVHQRCLTADNLQRRGWPNAGSCQLCWSGAETCAHLFVHCRFTSTVWRKLRTWSAATFRAPGPSFHTTEDWWLKARKQVPKPLRRDFNTVVILVHWKIWKERNARIFEGAQHSAEEVFDGIRDDIAIWRSAGLIVATE
jgi:hypothetical protein